MSAGNIPFSDTKPLKLMSGTTVVAEYTPNENCDVQIRDILKSTVASAVSAKPSFIGQIAVDSSGYIYIANGTSSTSNWKKVTVT